ncbi:MAG: hypothetical protein DI598_18845 [Pseudopedobacter saltans]|uniref:Uncharacterized protein n=1 Tax=Pseudopedobacter saltans TaxID=151895 RepID=A0A2W5EA17_9SPHI|nr:MAG: hypothetical protein DI598_18845 [Pseudopedobacter saltans]
MGLRITNTNADYSANAIGSTDWRIQFGIDVGANAAQKSALVNLNNQLVAAGLWSKILVAPFIGSGASQQSMLFDESGRKLTFSGSPVFDANGFTPTDGGYATFPTYFPNGAMSVVSMGVQNVTAEPNGGSGWMLGILGANIVAGAARKAYGESFITFLGKDSNAGFLIKSGAAQINGTGLIQIGRFDKGDGNQYYYSLDGTTVLDQNGFDAQNPVYAGESITIGKGQSKDGSNAGHTNAKIGFAYIGSLNQMEAQTMAGIVSTYMAAIGRQ